MPGPVHNAADIKEPQYDAVRKEHFWVITPAMRVTEDEIISAHAGKNINVDPARIVHFPPPSCYHCKMPWITVQSVPCLGDIEAQFKDYERRGARHG